MTKILVKKISFSTYIKIVALFGASLGLLMTTLFLLMLPTILSYDTSSETFSIVPFIAAYIFAPIMATMAFVLWGTMSYPMFLLIRKVFKKLTLEVELVPVEIKPLPEEITTNQNSEF